MFRFKVVLGVLFGLIVLIIAVLGVISYQKSQAFIQTSAMVDHTRQVLDQTEVISSHYKDIQLESNAFYITKDSGALGRYETAKQSISTELDHLRSLMEGKRGERALVDSLDHLLANLELFADSAFTKNSIQVEHRIEVTRNFRYQIQNILDKIRAQEIAELSSSQRIYSRNVSAFQATFIVLLAVIYVLLLTTFFSIRTNFNIRIRAEEKLRRANDLSSKLFHETPVGIVISHLNDGAIIDCNKTYETLVNYTHRELIGQNAVSLKILDSAEKRSQIVHDALRAGMADHIEVQLKPKDKDPIWTSISMQPIRIDQQDCLLTVVRDLSVYKRAEAEIKKALTTEKELNKMKSNFVTLASHEFRTPLTTILSSSFLIENYSSGENDEKIRKHLSRIKASVNLLTSILDEFLSLSKIEEGLLQPHYEDADLKNYIESICLNLQSFSKPGQKIDYRHSGPSHVFIDKVLMGNIVNNLVSNAIKYSPENTIITVSSSVNDQIYLSVKDSGIGIPEADQKNLFKRFYRASNAGNVQGTGLGLHIMKHYVDMLHGSVEVESHPGEGSEFRVMLELHEN